MQEILRSAASMSKTLTKWHFILKKTQMLNFFHSNQDTQLDILLFIDLIYKTNYSQQLDHQKKNMYDKLVH